MKIEIFDAKLFQFDIVYTGEERKAFGINHNASIIIVRDGLVFEALIPERENGQLNFLRLKNDTAIGKIQDRLGVVRAAEQNR